MNQNNKFTLVVGFFLVAIALQLGNIQVKSGTDLTKGNVLGNVAGIITQPTIDQINPGQAAIGETISITGSSFAAQGNDIYFCYAQDIDCSGAHSGVLSDQKPVDGGLPVTLVKALNPVMRATGDASASVSDPATPTMSELISGDYSVYIINAIGKSDAVPFKVVDNATVQADISSDPVSLKLGDSVALPDGLSTIKFDSIIKDNRCPAEGVCAELAKSKGQREVVLRFALTPVGADASQAEPKYVDIHLPKSGDAVMTNGYTLDLTSVTPSSYPHDRDESGYIANIVEGKSTVQAVPTSSDSPVSMDSAKTTLGKDFQIKLGETKLFDKQNHKLTFNQFTDRNCPTDEDPNASGLCVPAKAFFSLANQKPCGDKTHMTCSGPLDFIISGLPDMMSSYGYDFNLKGIDLDPATTATLNISKTK